MFHSLRSRLTLIFVGLAIGPLVFVAAVVALLSVASLEDQSLALQRQLSVGIGSELRAFVDGWENELVLLDKVHGLGTLERAEQREMLANILHCQQACQEIALLNQDGQEHIRMSRTSVFLDDDLQNRAENEEFLHPATRGETYFGPVRFDEAIREPLLTVAVPLFDERSGKVVSIVVADLRFKRIWDLLAAIELPKEGDAYVVNQAGHVVAHRDPAIVLRGDKIDLPVRDGRAEGLSGTEVIVAADSVRLGDQELIVVAEQPVDAALELAANILKAAALVTIAALVLAVTLIVLTTRRVVRPIEALAGSARDIAHGDFSKEVEIPPGSDEITALARAFRAMTRALREREETLRVRNATLQAEVSERVRAEAALKNSMERFRGFFEGIPIGTAMTDDPTKPFTVNQVLADFLGYRKEELECEPALTTIEMFTHPEDLDGEMRLIEELMTGKIQQYRMEKRYVRKDGSIAWGDLTTILLRDEQSGSTLGLSAIIDITESKRIESQLRQAEKMSAVGRLAAGVAHHFNNMLTAIIGSATFALEESPPQSTAREDISCVIETSERAAELVRRIMILTQQQMVKPAVIHLNELLLDLDGTLRCLIPENIKMVVVPGAQTSRVEADPHEIERALVNLILNACDAISDTGTITIETASVSIDGKDVKPQAGIMPGAYCTLSVHDSGCGMSDEAKNHLFEPFFTTKDTGEGAGLGLATVYGIMQQHKGYIRVESQTGHGTKVELYFPAIENSAGIPQEPYNHSDDRRRSNDAMTLVED